MSTAHRVTQDPPFVLSREHADPSAHAALRRRLRSGDLVRIVRGVLAPAEWWDGLGTRERHLAVMRAAVLSREREIVFSHWSAAAAWDLPVLGGFPDAAHAIDSRTSGGRSDDRLVRHCEDVPDGLVRIDGLVVTGLARSVVDLARVTDLTIGVMAADAALAGRVAVEHPAVAKSELLSELPPRGARGVARARSAIEFADARSESPGESLSRVSMWRAGLPVPELQHEFRDSIGRMPVDFWWPRSGVIGEFDGFAKYQREEFTAGRTAAEVVVDEKRREDRLRALGPRLVRWGWEEALSPARLRALLAPHLTERYRY